MGDGVQRGPEFRWFAWHPVHTSDRGWRWLRPVWRQRRSWSAESHYGWHSAAWWSHRVERPEPPATPRLDPDSVLVGNTLRIGDDRVVMSQHGVRWDDQHFPADTEHFPHDAQHPVPGCWFCVHDPRPGSVLRGR